MKFEHFRLRGIGPFLDEVSVDLAAIPGRIVAVCGDPGAGKSTLLEVLGGGTLYRETPTRGSLTSLAQGRDSFVEARVVNGARHTIRHTLDNISKRSESLVLDEAGAPVLAETKTTVFDAWAKAHLPSPEVFYSSVFAAQGSGGFLEMRPGERKAVLSRVLGIEHIEVHAEKARESARAAKGQLEVAAARLGELPPGDVATVEAEEARAREAAEAATRGLAEVRDLAAAGARYREIEAQLRAAEEQQAAGLRERIRNNETVLADEVRIRAAAARVEAIRAALTEHEAEAGASSARLAGHEARRRDASARAVRAQQRSRELSARLDMARARLRTRDGIATALAAIPAAAARVTEGEAALAKLRGELDAATDAIAAGAEGRVEVLRGHLGLIARGDAEDPKQSALDALLEDDGAARDQAAAPGRAGGARRAIADATRALEAARRDLAGLEAQAARSGEVEAAEAEIVIIEADLVSARAEEEAAGGDAAAAARAVDVERAAGEACRAAMAALSQESERLLGLAKRMEILQAAEARLAELRPMLAAAEAEAADARSRLAELAPPVAPPNQGDVEAAERTARAADLALAAAQQRLASIRATEERRVTLQRERAHAETWTAIWTRMSLELGPAGLPAVLIDAAGPELTAMVNDLLHTCVGSRWTVSIDTTRTSADGKRQIEGCEVRVLDTEAGREGGGETYSGGERAILGEAIALALSMVAMRRSTAEECTIVRDETAAPLGRYAPAYVTMLRRAADIVRCTQVLVITHQPEVIALADARIEIRGGKVEVVS